MVSCSFCSKSSAYQHTSGLEYCKECAESKLGTLEIVTDSLTDDIIKTGAWVGTALACASNPVGWGIATGLFAVDRTKKILKLFF